MLVDIKLMVPILSKVVEYVYDFFKFKKMYNLLLSTNGKEMTLKDGVYYFNLKFENKTKEEIKIKDIYVKKGSLKIGRKILVNHFPEIKYDTFNAEKIDIKLNSFPPFETSGNECIELLSFFGANFIKLYVKYQSITIKKSMMKSDVRITSIYLSLE